MSQDDKLFLDFDFSEDDISFVAKVFYDESKLILQNLDQLITSIEENPRNEVLLQDLFRKVHTLKGSVGPVPGGQLLGSLAHEFEALIVKFQKARVALSPDALALFSKSSQLIQILAANLRDKREILPEELSEVIETLGKYGGFQIETSAEQSSSRSAVGSSEELDPEKKSEIILSEKSYHELQELRPLAKQMSEHAKQILEHKNVDLIFVQGMAQLAQGFSEKFQHILDFVEMVTCQEAWAGLNYLAKQAARDVHKKIRLETKGFQNSLPRGQAHRLYEALVHLTRNSIDHGVESEEERALLGKKEFGTISISVQERSDFYLIDFVDDGQGLRTEVILKKALEKKLLTLEESQNLSDKEIQQLIFRPGFSTKEKISTLSGRGVGMDVVQQSITELRGQIEISSLPHKGTLFRIRLPK